MYRKCCGNLCSKSILIWVIDVGSYGEFQKSHQAFRTAQGSYGGSRVRKGNWQIEISVR